MSTNTVDFGKLVQKMQRASVTQDGQAHRPTIWGGRFDHNEPDELDRSRLQAFLDVWRNLWNKMPYRVWEYVSEIQWADDVGAAGGFTDPRFLLRAEIFGEGGHLSLRRDGGHWLWRYVGPEGQGLPDEFRLVAPDEPEDTEAAEAKGKFTVKDFWQAQPQAVLRRYDEHVLLWGEEVVDPATQTPTGVWWEDRVAASTLKYPASVSGRPRVQLTFWRFTEDGQTAFIWYRELQ